MIPRFQTQAILTALADTPVVFIQGARQTGKSTLVADLARHGYAAEVLTFDNATVLAAAKADPQGFVLGLPERVILDEVQRAPEIFLSLKYSVDLNRKPGRFLLTGSADAMTLPRLADALVGRMEAITLTPLLQSEIETLTPPDFLDCVFKSDALRIGVITGGDWPALVGRITRGGYPEAVTKKLPARRRAWFEAYLATLLERDIRDLAQIHAHLELPRLLRLAATRAGGLLNFADLSRDAAIPVSTLQRHWALFEGVFLLRTLPAYTPGNLSTRLVKAPKVLFHDTGLLCHLLGLDEARLRSDDLMTGAVLENFVGAELLKLLSLSPDRIGLFHFRSHTHREIDFILEAADGSVVAIEVKKTAAPTGDDFRHLRQMKEDLGDRFRRGLVLHTGDTLAPFGPDLYAVPIAALWRGLRP